MHSKLHVGNVAAILSGCRLLAQQHQCSLHASRAAVAGPLCFQNTCVLPACPATESHTLQFQTWRLLSQHVSKFISQLFKRLQCLLQCWKVCVQLTFICSAANQLPAGPHSMNCAYYLYHTIASSSSATPSQHRHCDCNQNDDWIEPGCETAVAWRNIVMPAATHLVP